jgi:hypothetical protein
VTLFYPDCSNNNWSSTQDAINFLEQLVPEGFSGMCHKVSEGSYYEDPYWPAVQQWCEQNNLPLIGYHYVTTDDPASQVQTWRGNNGGMLAMLDWEDNSGDLSNLAAVVDAFKTAGVTVQLGYYAQWYWSQEGGGDLSGLANALVSSGYPDGSGYASTIYANSWHFRCRMGAVRKRHPGRVAVHQQRKHRGFHGRLQRLPRHRHHGPVRHRAHARAGTRQQLGK